MLRYRCFESEKPCIKDIFSPERNRSDRRIEETDSTLRHREQQLGDLLRAALNGDEAAYRQFLDLFSQALRPVVRSACLRAGLQLSEHEDILQEVMLAVHAKRYTWQTSEPLGPWVQAIVRYKVIDTFRRRGRRIEIPIEDVIDDLPAPIAEIEPSAASILDRYMSALTTRQYDIVKSVSIEDASIRQTANRLSMTEGAVRVALHRAIASLTRAYRNSLS